jgi:hypothetical protein
MVNPMQAPFSAFKQNYKPQVSPEPLKDFHPAHKTVKLEILQRPAPGLRASPYLLTPMALWAGGRWRVDSRCLSVLHRLMSGTGTLQAV